GRRTPRRRRPPRGRGDRFMSARLRATVVVLCSLLLTAELSASAASRKPHHGRMQHTASAKKPAPAPIDEQALKTQIMLDRAGYSPGEIDGSMGTSTQRALEAFTKDGGKADGLPTDALTSYRISDEDVAGPFTPNIPSRMEDMAKEPAL